MFSKTEGKVNELIAFHHKFWAFFARKNVPNSKKEAKYQSSACKWLVMIVG
jgi:hypothetical protein